MLHEKILYAMQVLTGLERAVISEEFDFDAPHEEDLSQLPVQERTRILNQALAKLRKDKTLKNWLS